MNFSFQINDSDDSDIIHELSEMLGVLSSDENQDGAQTPKFTQRSNEFMISPRLEMEIFSQELAQTR